jgi:hypothetical protein
VKAVLRPQWNDGYGGRRAEANRKAENILPPRRCRRMNIVETFEGQPPAQSPSPTQNRIDTSSPTPRIPQRTDDRLRLQPRAGTPGQCPHEVAYPPSTDANASPPRIVAIKKSRPHRFRRKR